MPYSTDDLEAALDALNEFEAARVEQIAADVAFLERLSTPMDQVASVAQDIANASTSDLIDSIRA